MKNLATICFFFFVVALEFVHAQNGRENWFPNRGNVGIGTRSPSENLEVIGNVRVSENIFTNTLQSTSISSGTLNLSGNGLISGYLGLGLLRPRKGWMYWVTLNCQGIFRPMD